METTEILPTHIADRVDFKIDIYNNVVGANTVVTRVLKQQFWYGQLGSGAKMRSGHAEDIFIANLIVTFPMCEDPTSYYQDREGHMFAFPVILVAGIWTWVPCWHNGTKASGVLILLQIDSKEEPPALLQVVRIWNLE